MHGIFNHHSSVDIRSTCCSSGEAVRRLLSEPHNCPCKTAEASLNPIEITHSVQSICRLYVKLDMNLEAR